LLLATAAAALALGPASPAYAHAELEETTPAAGATLDAAPDAVTLSFSEPVEAAFGAIRVYDENARRVDTGASRHPAGRSDAVTVGLGDLPNGGYVVTWRVVSADSHPVQGAFTFRVGPGGGGDTGALVTRLLAQQGGSAVVGGLFAAVRLLAFAALVLLVGGGLFVHLLWPAGLDDRRAVRLLRTAAVATALTGVAGLGLQGAYAGGLPLGDAAKPDVLRSVLETRFGQAWAARAGLAVLALLLVSRRRLRIPAALAGLGLLVTVVAPGHAATGMQVPLALVSDTVHVGAAAAWLGGLALLACCALPAGATGAVPRFSALALGCVVTLVVTGSYQSWRAVGTLPALWGTTYGVLLLAKLGGFLVLVGLGWLGRSWVRRHRAGAGPDDVRTLRRSVAAEAGVGVVVLGLTALLVNAQPARTAYAKPFSTTVTAGPLQVNVVVDPAKSRRPIAIHAYTLAATGQIAEVAEFTGTMRLPARDIGPLDVPFVRAGPGHFVASGFQVPLPGSWTLDLTARTSEVDQFTASATVGFR
jgi:copper transport protein